MCGNEKFVKECLHKDCNLYPYRLGKDFGGQTEIKSRETVPVMKEV